MYHETLLRKARQANVRVLLIGAGEYGVSFVFQSRRVPGLNVAAIADRRLDAARAAFRHAGYGDDDILACDTRERALAAIESGRRVIAEDARILMDLPLDVVVEATGVPEAGATHAEAAIAAGKHVVMVSKETDSVAGPLFQARARRSGVVYTPVDGDQPSLLMQLVQWARVVGLEIFCAGKSSEYDFVFDPARGTVDCLERSVAAPELGSLWDLGRRRTAELAQARSEMLTALPQHTVPDLTEMGIVANAMDLNADVPEFHAPVARPLEIADMLCPKDRGGLLANANVVDVVNCLRRPDEASMAGGVFVVVACEDARTWEVLRAKGHVVNRAGNAAMILRPSHLLGVESATSVLMAALENRCSGPEETQPRVDVCGRTTKPLAAGTNLSAVGHHHRIDGIEGLMLPARAAIGDNPVPYYLMANRTLLRDVPAGTLITADMVAAPSDSALWRLRREMDRHFGLPGIE